MQVRTKAELEMAQAELDDAKVTYHRHSEKTDIVGTGKYEHMPKGTKYKGVHVLLAQALIKKGYAQSAN